MEFPVSVLSWLGLLVSLEWSRGTESMAVTDNLHTMDFCNMEQVNLTCNGVNEPKVILIREAKYGRMRLGRCALRDLGYLGCSDDSTHILDSRCSGRSECSFKLPDPELFNLQSCPSDVTPYLQVEFNCVPVISRKQSTCFTAESIKITNGHRYLSNFINNQSIIDFHIHKINNNNIINGNRRESTEEQQKCYYIIEASPGQQINITLFNFFDSNQFAHKSNSTSSSELQPPIFSYSPNYQNDQERTSSIASRKRNRKRSLENIDHQSISVNPEKDRTLTDKRSLPITGGTIKNSVKSKQTGSSDLAEVKSLDVVKDSVRRANQPFPQMSAQIGQYSPLHKSTHHHLQKARICIEVAYVNELPAEKASNSSPRYKRKAAGREIRNNDGEDVHCNGTETKQSRAFWKEEKEIYDRNFYERNLPPFPQPSIERRRRSTNLERRPISICEDDPRIVQVLITRSSRLRVEVRNQVNLLKGRQGAYMFKFEAIGCRDPEPIAGAWFHRHGNSLSVTCNHSSDVTYHVTCKNGKWIGQIGNCSQTGKSILKLNQKSTKEDYFPFGILIMVVVGVAIGIVVGGMFLCLVVACTKNCSTPTNLHTAAEYQSILVNNSSLSTTTSTTTKISDHHQQQKQQPNNRTTTTNWSVSDYYPPLNQQSTLALADYNYFRDTGYHDSLQQSETRPSDDLACPQDHHHHHLYHHRHHHQDQMFPKCCTYNPEGLFDSSANEESMILCEAQSSVKCHPHKNATNTTTTTIATSSTISSSTPFKTFKSSFCPKTISTKFFVPTSGILPDSFVDSQCCNNCRELSRDGIAVETTCSCCSRKEENHKHDNSSFITPSFHLQSLKPDLTQLNN